jgi:REP element-mobilizing transposase RayT
MKQRGRVLNIERVQDSRRDPVVPRNLVILNYVVTSNHIHLLVQDVNGRNVIPKSIQLVAGRAGQEFNNRKKRKGAFWNE